MVLGVLGWFLGGFEVVWGHFSWFWAVFPMIGGFRLPDAALLAAYSRQNEGLAKGTKTSLLEALITDLSKTAKNTLSRVSATTQFLRLFCEHFKKHQIFFVH